MCFHKWDNDYTSLLSTFNLPTLSTRRSISKLCLLYKITNNLLYFPSDIFSHKYPPSYASCHFDRLTFTILFSHSSASKNSFVTSVLSLWNSLPYHMKSRSSLITFTINSPSFMTLKSIIYYQSLILSLLYLVL